MIFPRHRSVEMKIKGKRARWMITADKLTQIMSHTKASVIAKSLLYLIHKIFFRQNDNIARSSSYSIRHRSLQNVTIIIWNLRRVLHCFDFWSRTLDIADSLTYEARKRRSWMKILLAVRYYDDSKSANVCWTSRWVWLVEVKTRICSHIDFNQQPKICVRLGGLSSWNQPSEVIKWNWRWAEDNWASDDVSHNWIELKQTNTFRVSLILIKIVALAMLWLPQFAVNGDSSVDVNGKGREKKKIKTIAKNWCGRK